MDQKSYENILVCDVSYGALINAKPLRIRLNKVDEFNRVYDRIKYQALFDLEKYNAVYDE